MLRSGKILLCFAVLAVGCGGDDKAKAVAGDKAPDQQGEAGAKKQPDPIEPATYHVEWLRCQAYFNARDKRKLAECFAPGAKLVLAGQATLAGPEAVVSYFEALWAAFPDYSIDAQASWVDGKTAAIAAVMSGTHKADYRGFAASGKQTRQLALWVVDLADDWKIEKATLYVDQAQTARQLGWATDQAPAEYVPFEFRDHVAAAGNKADEAAVAHVKRYGELFNRRDFDGLLALFSDDVKVWHPSPDGRVEGKDALRASLEPFFASVPDARHNTTRVFAVGEWAIAEHTVTATHAGKPIAIDGAVVFRLEDGLITRTWSFQNLGAAR